MFANSESETKVTVGLCVKNSEKTIKECLESILNQNYPKHLMEIIVVDGRSQDHTMNIIMKSISSSNMSAMFFCDEGKGIASARQMVLDETNNNYVIFVDGDVLLSPDFVRAQIRFMQSHSGIAIAIGRFCYRKGLQKTLPATLQGLAKHVDTLEWAKRARVKRKKPSGFPTNDASIYLVEASKRVGGFDKTITGASEDEDIIIRMKKQGWLIALNEQAKFFALSRETWQALWKENVWFGYGKHFLSHKYQDGHFFLHNLPLIYIYVGFKQSLRCYRLTSQKKSVLLPLLGFFYATSLYFGFIRAHQEGYGHKKVHFARASAKSVALGDGI